MRCPYCFQAIPDRSDRCPACGSRLPDIGGRAQAADNAGLRSRLLTLNDRQLIGLVGGTLLLLACLCLGGLLLLRPLLLASPVAAAIPGLAGPTPLPTYQVTRATIATATPAAFVEVCGSDNSFCARLPAGWVVVDQRGPGWLRTVDIIVDEYEWAPELFVAGTPPRQPRLVIVPPSLIDLEQGRIAQIVIGKNIQPDVPLALDELELLARQQSELLALLTSPLVSQDLAVRRTDRVEVNGREAALLVFEASATTGEETIPVRVYLYLIPAGEQLYLFSYLADETTWVSQRQIFEDVLASLQVEG